MRKPLRWYRQAAEQGDTDAQFRLAFRYAFGIDAPHDYGEAARWYRLVAVKGHALAQYELGLMYAEGRGVPQDYGEAARWYRLVAEQGATPRGSTASELMYANGEGVLKDSVLAHMWLNIGSANGSEVARTLRGTLERDMARDEISRATSNWRRRAWPRTTMTTGPRHQETNEEIGYENTPDDAGPNHRLGILP